MYAVIMTGGKQYTVKPGDVLEIEKVAGDVDSQITFGEILAVGDEGKALNVGTPRVEGASVTAKILAQDVLGEKVVAFKMKRRKGYRRTKGHRQQYTKIEIGEIKA